MIELFGAEWFNPINEDCLAFIKHLNIIKYYLDPELEFMFYLKNKQENTRLDYNIIPSDVSLGLLASFDS